MRKIISELYSTLDANVYAILDGASIEDLPALLEEHDVENICLYRGELDDGLKLMAPYLVKLKRSSPFLKLWMEEGLFQHWGIFAVSYADIRVMRKHFRKFLMVKDPEGKQIYFRYYDPRVLSSYLPSASQDELNLLYGPVMRYFAENRKKELLVFEKSIKAKKIHFETV